MLPIASNHDAAVPAGTSVPVKNQQSCWSVGCHANLVGEPDAANPHVRFDERGVEPEHGGLLGHRHTKEPATRKATPKPPRHSSTLLRVLDGQPGHMVMLKAFESMAVKPSAVAGNV